MGLLLIDIKSMVLEVVIKQALGFWFVQMRISIISSSCVELKTFVVYLVERRLTLMSVFRSKTCAVDYLPSPW